MSRPALPSLDLSLENLVPRLTTKRLGRSFEFIAACASTNDEVAARAAAEAQADGQPQAPEGLVIVADKQTSGRGRRGRSWHSPAGENLYCSLLLRPALPPRLLSTLPLLAGAGLAEALAMLGFVPRLKWPNDVLLETPVGRRKVAGVLAEAVVEGNRVRHLVLGMGVNVNSTSFPEPLLSVATSLRLVSGEVLDRAWLLAHFLNAFESLYESLISSGPAAGIRAWSRRAILGERCSVVQSGERIEGVASAIDETGALLLTTAAGVAMTVHSGEIHELDSR